MNGVSSDWAGPIPRGVYFYGVNESGSTPTPDGPLWGSGTPLNLGPWE